MNVNKLMYDFVFFDNYNTILIAVIIIIFMA